MIKVIEAPESSALLIHLFQEIEKNDAEKINSIIRKEITSTTLIIVYIDTFGGDFNAALSIYSSLRFLSEQRPEIQIVGMAQRAGSGGLLVLQGCTTRISASDGSFSIHPIHIRKNSVHWHSEVMSAFQKALEVSVSEYKQAEKIFIENLPSLQIEFQKELEEILISRTKLKRGNIKEIMALKEPKKFSPQEALEVGIVDKISEI